MTPGRSTLRSLIWIALPAVLCAGARAQTPEPKTELPDSSYLALTLELPPEATFDATILRETRGGTQRSLQRFRVSNLEFVGCMLRLRRTIHTDQMTGVASSRRIEHWEIPLKSVALNKLESRPVMVRGDARLEPQPYEVTLYAAKRSDNPFLVYDEDRRLQSRTDQFFLHIRESTSAHRFARLLADAGNRCETWKTGPIKPIR